MYSSVKVVHPQRPLTGVDRESSRTWADLGPACHRSRRIHRKQNLPKSAISPDGP